MVELKSKTPLEGLLPITAGACSVVEELPTQMTSITPLGDPAKLGLTLPNPERMTSSGDTRVLWFGRNEFLLMDAAPTDEMRAHAAVVDQSDAWAVAILSGATSEAVLARLVPVDLRVESFPIGSSIRTQLQHLNVSLTRTGDDSFMILAFRSMAQSLVAELKTAMEHVAARG